MRTAKTDKRRGLPPDLRSLKVFKVRSPSGKSWGWLRVGELGGLREQVPTVVDQLFTVAY